MKSFFLVFAMGATALAGTASAQQRDVGYPHASVGAQAILNADYATAERQLRNSEVAKHDPGRLINLGIVLARTGRTDAAIRQFERVLGEGDIELIVADGRSMMSHDIARAALASLGQR